MDSLFFFEQTTYWSQGDEHAHFEWLDRIGCVQDARGRGSRVYLAIDEKAVSESDLRELGADLTQPQNIKPIPDEFDDAQD